MIRLIVDPTAPDPAAIARAAAAIRSGGIIAMPTDTLYGLAVDPFQPRAIERVFAVKERGRTHGLPLVAADVTQVEDLFGPLSGAAQRLVAHFWPGPLTLLLAAPSRLAEDVGEGTGTVAIRVPAHEVTRALCRAVGRPVTATSANLSGQPATDDPVVVQSSLGERLDMVLDSGRTPGGPASTIIDVSNSAGANQGGDSVRLIRAGAIAWDAIEACLRR